MSGLVCSVDISKYCKWLKHRKPSSEMCSTRKYPNPSQGRLTENPRGRGLSKAQFLKESMMPNWNFWRGGEGVQSKKKPFMGGMDIFWPGATQCSHQLFLNKQRSQTKLHLIYIF